MLFNLPAVWAAVRSLIRHYWALCLGLALVALGCGVGLWIVQGLK